MARYHESQCHHCRREGLKLFLKGDRCFSNKCSFERRGYPPGQHGQGRVKHTNYGIQLRAKQRIKRIYGIMERQFRNYFAKAEHQKGVTGENLLMLLERRLDNMVFRLGFASSRTEARLLVRHSHFMVNGRKVNLPSFLTKPGDVISVCSPSQKVTKILSAMETIDRRGVPSWLDLDRQNFRGTVKALPLREELTMPIDEHLVVEFYSK